MAEKPTYEELGHWVKELENEATERKRLQDALKESEEKYRRLTDAITDYIYSVCIEDGLPVETVHGPACEAVTGYTVEEFKANPYLWSCQHPYHDAQLLLPYVRAYPSIQGSDRGYRYLHTLLRHKLV